jgi:thiosulfate dehydrogenase
MMHKWWLAPMLLLALVSSAAAGSAPQARSAGKIDAAALALHGDPAHGVPPCLSCHGPAGQGNAAAGFPRLAGLPADYIVAQLQALADGRREATMMKPIAKPLTLAQQQALGAYFAALSTPAAPTSTQPVPARGAELAQYGRWSDELPACERCHGPRGVGVGEAFPPLAGQPAAYLASQLRAWKARKRPAGPLGLMGTVAGKLSEADILAVAEYFSAQPAHSGEEQP